MPQLGYHTSHFRSGFMAARGGHFVSLRKMKNEKVEIPNTTTVATTPKS